MLTACSANSEHTKITDEKLFEKFNEAEKTANHAVSSYKSAMQLKKLVRQV